MRLAHLAAATSALMLMASPAMAAAPNPASKLSVASSQSVRAGSKVKNSSEFAPLLGVAAVILVLVGAGLAFDVFDSGNDTPTSP